MCSLEDANKQSIVSGLENWLLQKPWDTEGKIKDFEVLRITDGAYPEETHHKIGRYLDELTGRIFRNKRDITVCPAMRSGVDKLYKERWAISPMGLQV